MPRRLRPALLAAALVALPACQTTQEAAEGAADVATDAANATADVATDVARATADVASDAYDEARDVLGVARVPDGARVAVARVGAPADTATGVSGTVTFVELTDGVRVRYDLAGLTPGAHGFHVHRTGSCAAGDFDGDGYAEAGGPAGPHLNPGNDPHGGIDADMDDKHAGDLGTSRSAPTAARRAPRTRARSRSRATGPSSAAPSSSTPTPTSSGTPGRWPAGAWAAAWSRRRTGGRAGRRSSAGRRAYARLSPTATESCLRPRPHGATPPRSSSPAS